MRLRKVVRVPMSLLAAAIVDILKHIIIVIVIILAACFLALHRCVAHGMRFQGFDPGGIIEVPLVMCLFFLVETEVSQVCSLRRSKSRADDIHRLLSKVFQTRRIPLMRDFQPRENCAYIAYFFT
jgi:hypothetical protein